MIFATFSNHKSIHSPTVYFVFIEESYLNENGFVDFEDAETLLTEVAEYAAALLEEGKISDYSYQSGDTCVYMQIDGWLGYLYAPDIEDTLSGNTSPIVDIFTFEPFEYEISNNVFKQMMMHGVKNQDEAAQEIVRTFAPSFQLTSNYDNSDVFLAQLSNITPNSIVIWNGHGGYNEEFGPVLSMGKVQNNLMLEFLVERQELFSDDSLLLYSDGHCCITHTTLETRWTRFWKSNVNKATARRSFAISITEMTIGLMHLASQGGIGYKSWFCYGEKEGMFVTEWSSGDLVWREIWELSGGEFSEILYAQEEFTGNESEPWIYTLNHRTVSKSEFDQEAPKNLEWWNSRKEPGSNSQYSYEEILEILGTA